MPNKAKSYLMDVFGFAVIASGIWRIWSAEGGQTGLWFGIVMGGIAFASATLFKLGRIFPANIAAGICLLVTGGWFAYEALIKKGIANAESRQLIVLGISIAIGLALLLMKDSANNVAKTDVAEAQTNSE